MVTNPWEDIGLEDYENHMGLDSVMQLQTMNQMMHGQFYRYPISSVMILGIAGGNGLVHIDHSKIKKVYGVDINKKYLAECVNRYPHLNNIFYPIYADLIKTNTKLPHSDIIVANLFIEYIGYNNFQHIVQQINPMYVSCIIQINNDNEGFVSDSPYLSVFDRVIEVHHKINETGLTLSMQNIGYRHIFNTDNLLPNGKKLLRIDYKLL